MKSLKKGFTLVELMVVIVIIGILAALAIPRFLGASNKAKATEFKPVLKQISTLEEAYRQERDSYSPTLTSIGFDAPGGGQSRFTYTLTGAAASTWQSEATVAVAIGTIPTTASVTWLHNAAGNGTDTKAAGTGAGSADLVAVSNWQ